MKRKIISLVLSSVLSLSLILTGCGSASGSAENNDQKTSSEETEQGEVQEAQSEDGSSEEGVVITLGCWGTTNDIAGLEEMLAGVQDAVPGVKEVQIVTYASTSDFWNNLPSQVAAGTAPDLATPTNENAYEYISGGLYTPFSRDLIDISNIEEAAIDVWTVDGELYGIPLDAQPTCLLLNTDLFTELGFTEDDYPQSWDDVRAICEKVSDPDNNFYGLCINPTGLFFMTQVVQGFGGSWGNGKTIDSPENREAIQWIIDMFKDKLAVSPSQLGDDWDGTTFASGKALMSIGGVWYLGNMNAAAPDTNYIALPIPQQDQSNKSSSLHSSAIVMLKSCKYPELASQVAAYMARNEGLKIRSETTGTVPANQELASEFYQNNPQFSRLEGSEKWSVAFGYPAQTSQFETAIVNDLTAVIFDSTSTTTAEEILSGLQEKFGTSE